MSRLWPETVRIALFPGHAHLQRRRWPGAATEHAAALPATDDPFEALAALGDLLQARPLPFGRNAAVALTVSDRYAACTALPWQAALTRPAEYRSYAQACFEQLGLTIDDGWVVHADYRSHGAPGFAHAFSRPWLEALRSQLAGHGLRLQRVLPVSALAYHRHRPASPAGEIVLLHERHAFTALVYRQRKLQQYDVEPATGQPAAACRRLLMRSAAACPGIVLLRGWTPDAAAPGLDPQPLQAALPDAGFERLHLRHWERP
ncbi:hypothetical protein [Chitinimonas koreensis]|uniref:hypothetical protein n=1 Tax=Chitinimonas koreensis TaxID=356302 RepID=UPI00040FF06F|nr:hypothetical protein [Chitinimonas koreensis]QNM94831.1 hypothetical protein H9L41_12895 [Chitinimonas koreensis]